MLKKLLFIGLVCMGVTAFMVSQASAGCCCNPRFCASWLQKGVQADLDLTETVDDGIIYPIEPYVGGEIVIQVYGFGLGGQLTGTLFCVPVPENGDYKQAINNIEACKKGRRLGHIKNKGKGGHGKGKGKGHQGACGIVEDVPIDLDSTPLTAGDTNDDCDDGECTASVILNIGFDDGQGQAACDVEFGEDTTEFFDFIPYGFFGKATVSPAGIELGIKCPTPLPPSLTITEECTAVEGGPYYCVPGSFPPDGDDLG